MSRPIRMLTRAAVTALLISPGAAIAQSAAERVLTVGDARDGEITAQDPTDDRRMYAADVWTFDADAGDAVAITMRSADIDTYLILRGPDGAVVAEDDDSGGDYDSTIEVRLPSAGRYEIVATTFDGALGPYTLELQAVDPSGFPDPTRAIELVPIAFGDDVNGSLAPADPIYRLRDAFADTYTFEAEGGTPIDISMSSPTFDTWITLVGPGGSTVATDDDGGRGVNSHLQTRATTSGTYHIVATSYGAQATGDYTLSLRSEHRAPTEGATELAEGDATDVPVTDGEGAAWFDGRAGESWILGIEGADGAYIEVYDAGESMLGSAESGTPMSEMQVMPTVDGPVVVRVSLWGPAAGSVSLRLERGEPIVVEPGRLRIGREVEGTIEATDPRSSETQAYVDMYTLELEPGATVTVEAVSDTMTPTLRVVSPLGEVYWPSTPASFSGLASRQHVTAAIGGQWMIAVSSWEPGSDYTIGVVEGVAPELSWPGVTTTPIMDDVPVSASITDDDPRHPERGTGMDVYPLEVETASVVEVTMTSDAFDTFLEIRNADGEVVATNDDYDGLNSMLRTQLTPGAWQIVATQYSAALGDYSLIVSRTASSGAAVVPLSLGESVDAPLVLEQVDEWTWLTGARASVELEAGVAVTASATLVGGWVTLSLLDEHGVAVASATGSGLGEPVAFSVTPPRAGHYVLLAQGESSEADTATMTIAEGAEAPDVAPYTDLWDGGWGGPMIDEPYIDPMMREPFFDPMLDY